MSRLPIKGDCQRAFDAMNARMDAIGQEDGPEHRAAHLLVAGDKATTVDAGAFPGMYGDLLDPEEYLSSGGFGLVMAFANDVIDGTSLIDVLVSVALQAVATGVLMERLRQEER